MRVKYPESAESLAKYSDTVRSIGDVMVIGIIMIRSFWKLRQTTDMPCDLI